MNKAKTIFCLFLFCLSFYYAKSVFKIDIVDLIKSNNSKTEVISNFSKKFLDSPVSLLDVDDKQIKHLNSNSNIINKNANSNNKDPIIYIYNTHQQEEYAHTAYNITPTVVTASMMLQDELKNLEISSFVEEKDIIKETKRRGLDYTGTYTVSFDYLKARKDEYQSLKYFFDIHRDSITGDASRIRIKDKNYASMMFLVGANFDSYEKNLKNANKMKSYLDKKYPGLVRNNYIQKNSSFYQYYNSNMFLVEIGGPENTLEEVYNTTVALADAIKNYVEG